MKVLSGSLEKIDRRETLRYLGCNPNAGAPEGVEEAIEGCERELLSAQSLKCVYDIFPVKREGDTLDLGFAKTDSRDLKKYLEGCGKIVLFAATAGAGVDRVIRRYSSLSPAKAAMCQALGAALVQRDLARGLDDREGAGFERELVVRHACIELGAVLEGGRDGKGAPRRRVRGIRVAVSVLGLVREGPEQPFLELRPLARKAGPPLHIGERLGRGEHLSQLVITRRHRP